MTSTHPIIDGAHYRQVLGHFLTGVTIITAIDPDSSAPVGLAASSFTSLSIDPPLVLFCAGKTSSSWARIKLAGRYCVNILGEDQEVLSRQFAGKGDKFAGVGWRPGPSGCPIIESALAYIDCSIHDEFDGGDHTIVVGRVLELGARDTGGPLGYYRGGYGAFGK